MKKLLIAAAMVCAAAFAQAATVNWAISNVKDSSGAAAATGWAVLAFYTAKDAGSAAIESAIAAKTAGSLAFESKPLSAGLGSGRVAAHDVAVASLDTTKNYDFYFVVFNDADATKATEYAMVSDLNKEYSGMDSIYKATANFSGATWQSVPEPTSGLLMLLGMAGLALRRRRA